MMVTRTSKVRKKTTNKNIIPVKYPGTITTRVSVQKIEIAKTTTPAKVGTVTWNATATATKVNLFNRLRPQL